MQLAPGAVALITAAVGTWLSTQHGEPYGTCVVVSLSPLTQTYTLVPLVGFTWAHARQTARAGAPHGGACAT